MTTTIIILLVLYSMHKMIRAAPGAIRFGMENREAVQGGMSLLRRMFGR